MRDQKRLLKERLITIVAFELQLIVLVQLHMSTQVTRTDKCRATNRALKKEQEIIIKPIETSKYTRDIAHTKYFLLSIDVELIEHPTVAN